MFNQLLKITIFTTIWFWLKPRWRGFLALTVFVLLVNVLHREYLDYVEISDNQGFLVWSYILKWGALFTGLVTYLICSSVGIKTVPQKRSQKPQIESTSESSIQGEDDGFNFLRDKTHLQSQADKLIDRDKHNFHDHD
jgi:hypothetical protein